MKKLVFFFIAISVICFTSCGNKIKQMDSNSDSDSIYPIDPNSLPDDWINDSTAKIVNDSNKL